MGNRLSEQKVDKVSGKEFIKIFSRLSKNDYDRLSSIRKKYCFKSNYEILQYLMRCFLRVADPDNAPIAEPVPAEIENMFTDLSESEKHFAFIKPKRRCSHQSPDTI